MSKVVVIGKFGSASGVRGEIKVNSYTEPAENILNYTDWLTQQNSNWQPVQLESCRKSGQFFVAKIKDLNDRDSAKLLTNQLIGINSSDLPQLPTGDYYWSDLVGLQVINLAGTKLGVVDHLLATGSNDILVVKNVAGNTHMIPYLKHVIKTVDLEGGCIHIDWDPDF